MIRMVIFPRGVSLLADSFGDDSSDTCGVHAYLVSLKPIQQRDADDGRLDASVVGERGERQRLHLDVNDSRLVDPLQERHLVLLRVVTERAVQTTLTCKQEPEDYRGNARKGNLKRKKK